MNACRIPVECVERFRQKNIDATMANFSALAGFCTLHVRPQFAAWQFAPGLTTPLPDGITQSMLERALVTWAMSANPDFSWVPMVGQPVGALAEYAQASGFVWRAEQLELQEKLRALLPGNIGLVEASTGIGKTHLFSDLALSLRETGQVIIAVPTVVVGEQWQSIWQSLGFPALAEVWGKARYGDDKLASQRQARAIEAAQLAPTVLCSHHILPKLLAKLGASPKLLVDEAHLLDKAVMSVAGSFLPIEAMGPWLVHWNERHGLPAGTVGEVDLPRGLLETIIKKMAPSLEGQATDWRASIVCDERSQPLVWLRHSQSALAALETLWKGVEQAWLFSGTLATSGADGGRSVRQMVRRLGLPAQRAQDLGRVRAPWRDKGVRVLLPAMVAGEDGQAWLGAYRDRKAIWHKEVAQTLSSLDRKLKTLVLMTSYADIKAVHALLGSAHGIVASSPDIAFEASRAQFAEEGAWVWLATGSAWAGMDLGSGVQRLIIASLPLPDPQTLTLAAHVEDAVFDAVCRFKQGIGRAVRDDQGLEREIWVMDGRINDRSRAWRSICHPFLQVLGEDYEVHGTFYPQTPSLVIGA